MLEPLLCVSFLKLSRTLPPPWGNRLLAPTLEVTVRQEQPGPQVLSRGGKFLHRPGAQRHCHLVAALSHAFPGPGVRTSHNGEASVGCSHPRTSQFLARWARGISLHSEVGLGLVFFLSA